MYVYFILCSIQHPSVFACTCFHTVSLHHSCYFVVSVCLLYTHFVFVCINFYLYCSNCMCMSILYCALYSILFILCSKQHPSVCLYSFSYCQFASFLLFPILCPLLCIGMFFLFHLSVTFLCNCTQGLGTMANSAERPKQDLQHWGCSAEDLVAGHLGLRWTLSG